MCLIFVSLYVLPAEIVDLLSPKSQRCVCLQDTSSCSNHCAVHCAVLCTNFRRKRRVPSVAVEPFQTSSKTMAHDLSAPAMAPKKAHVQLRVLR